MESMFQQVGAAVPLLMVLPRKACEGPGLRNMIKKVGVLLGRSVRTAEAGTAAEVLNP